MANQISKSSKTELALDLIEKLSKTSLNVDIDFNFYKGYVKFYMASHISWYGDLYLTDELDDEWFINDYNEIVDKINGQIESENDKFGKINVIYTYVSPIGELK